MFICSCVFALQLLNKFFLCSIVRRILASNSNQMKAMYCMLLSLSSIFPTNFLFLHLFKLGPVKMIHLQLFYTVALLKSALALTAGSYQRGSLTLVTLSQWFDTELQVMPVKCYCKASIRDSDLTSLFRGTIYWKLSLQFLEGDTKVGILSKKNAAIGAQTRMECQLFFFCVSFLLSWPPEK